MQDYLIPTSLVRLSVAVPGDINSISPVTPNFVRSTREGDLNISTLLFGTHYKIPMEGIISPSSTGDLADEDFGVSSSKLDLEGKQDGTNLMSYTMTFNDKLFFYPQLVIRGHIELDESQSSANPLTDYYGEYIVTDLLTTSKLHFRLNRKASNCEFNIHETIGNTTTKLGGYDLGSGEDEVDFEFRYLEHGKHGLYTYTLEDDAESIYTRRWRGNLSGRYNECTMGFTLVNEATSIKHAKSDQIYVKYPLLYFTYNPLNDIEVGQVRIYDDHNSSDTDDWTRVISRAYEFEGNRVIENGLIRAIIKSENPIIELWQWYRYPTTQGGTETWGKIGDIVPLNSNKLPATQIQNVVWENITPNQVRVKVNFGNTIYVIVMSRGAPYVTILDKYSKEFRLITPMTRFAAPFSSNHNYDLDSDNGYPDARSEVSETIATSNINDNWCSWFGATDHEWGWLANQFKPSGIKVTQYDYLKDGDTDPLKIELSYNRPGNIYGIGGLIDFDASEINNVPTPFIVGNPDLYVKYRANESLYSFKQSNFLRRRHIG